MAWLVAVTLLAAFPAADAGTAEDPELVDAAGDQVGPEALDLLAAWIESGNRSLVDGERGLVDAHLLVGRLGPTDVATYDLTWSAATILDPANETSRRGVRVSWSAGTGSWEPLTWDDEAEAWQTAGPNGPVGGDAATGHLVAVGVPTGGGVLPVLTEFAMESRLGALPLASDQASSSQASYSKEGPFRVVDALDLPSRPYDLVGETDVGLRVPVDLIGGWVDETDEGIVATYAVRELTGAGVLHCPWWTVRFFAIDTLEGGDIVVSSHNSLRIDDGVVSFAFSGGRDDWEPHGSTPTEQDDSEGFPVIVEMAFGSPGAVRLAMLGASWNGTRGLEDSYHTLGLSCRGAENEWEERDELTIDPTGVLAVPGVPIPLLLAVLGLVAAARRR